MTEIDLIPPNYREQLRIRRWTRLFVTGAITIMVLTLLTRGLLAYLIYHQSDVIEGLQQTRTSVLNNEQVLDELINRKSDMQHKLDMLATLETGPSTDGLFIAIDNAMSRDIWFQELGYTSRAENGKGKGEPVSAPQAGGPGKFLTSVEIKGQASNHSALASFVNRLNAQPIFGSVRIVNTQLRRYTQTEVVDFTLAASARASQGS